MNILPISNIYYLDKILLSLCNFRILLVDFSSFILIYFIIFYKGFRNILYIYPYHVSYFYCFLFCSSDIVTNGF